VGPLRPMMNGDPVSFFNRLEATTFVTTVVVFSRAFKVFITLYDIILSKNLKNASGVNTLSTF